MTLRSCALAVAVALSLAGCSDGPLPVRATRVLEVAGLRAVVNGAALSPDGSLVVVGDMDGDLIAREVPAGAERWKVPVHPRGAARSIDGVAFSPDGSLLATIGHGARTVELWEAATGRQAAVLSIGQSRGSAFQPTERVLVVVGGTTIHLVDLERGEVVRTLPNAHQGDRVDSLAFTEDGDWLFAPDTHDRGLRILHVPGGKGFSVLRGEGPFYKAMALALGASMVALLRPGDTEGRGPYGVEVWRLTYRAK